MLTTIRMLTYYRPGGPFGVRTCRTRKSPENDTGGFAYLRFSSMTSLPVEASNTLAMLRPVHTSNLPFGEYTSSPHNSVRGSNT
jgi:hypothetical protein